MPTFILLNVMLRTVERLQGENGLGHRDLVLPTLIWPVTVLVLGCWHPTDARAWWEV